LALVFSKVSTVATGLRCAVKLSVTLKLVARVCSLGG
jgi:hypothetical protein